MHAIATLLLGLLILLCSLSPAQAGIKAKLLQETIEAMTRTAGKEVAEEGVERLTASMTKLAAKHGDELVSRAFTRVGPRAGRLATAAGSQGDVVLKLIAQHGDAAIPLATRPASLSLIQKFGSEAAEACVRHGGPIAEPIVEKFGQAGAAALTKVVSDQNARRMVLLTADGTMKRELIDVVIQFGDQACEFIWRNKLALSASATGVAAVAAFVASPEEFLNGTAALSGAIIQPLVEVPKAVAVETVRQVNGFGWLVLMFGSLAAVMIFLSGLWEHRFLHAGSVCLKAAWQRLVQKWRA